VVITDNLKEFQRVEGLSVRPEGFRVI
jgi:hypothetical protein